MTSPRIALVAGGLSIGGTTTFLRYLAHALMQAGARVEVLSFKWSNPMAREFERDGIPVHLEDNRRLIHEDLLASGYEKLREFGPDAVFAVVGSASFEMLRYAPESVLRVGMIHDHYQIVYDLLRRYEPWMDAIATVSRKTWEHAGVIMPNIPCEYLAHGIRLASWEPRANDPGQPLRILYFGRYQESHKQVSMFPKVIAELERRKIPFQWTFHGQGPDRELLTVPLASQVEAGTVKFSMPVDHAQVGGIIAAHEVYTHAAVHEAGPLTLLEAMNYGLVPVCGDIPCLIDEVIRPGENGFRVKVDDPVAYADAIQRLHEDRSLLRNLSVAARNTITADFSAEAMAGRYLDFISRHRRGPGAPKSAWPSRVDTRSIVLEGLRYSPLLRPVRRVLKKIAALHSS